MPDRFLKVLYLSAEVVPFAKTGGLADVAGALPRAIRSLGHDIRVMMPRYGRIDVRKFGLTTLCADVPVPMDEQIEHATILAGRIGAGPDETPVYFVDSDRYFDRQGIYMYPDDAERFIFFSRCALETCKALGWAPDVIHCNEWHTALIPNWLTTVYSKDAALRRVATLYTAHNLEYQGIFGHRVLEIAGLADMGFIAHPEVAVDLNQVVDLMARGLMFADVINTVSETHAREILTPEYGQGLDPLLRDRRDRLHGILNGIDTRLYDPSTDANIADCFDGEHLAGKSADKAALQAEARLTPDPEAPLIAIVARLTDQKGIDLVASSIESMLQELGCQFVMMGTGELRYHELFSALATRYPGRLAVFLTFNRPLEQRIYAGSDIYLMPSRREPCGLNQMIAMRYGCVPVVHAVGGLADSVNNYRADTDEGTGFTFVDYDAAALQAAVVRALEAYRHREAWTRLIRRCMAQDVSWDRSAARYVELYELAIAFHRDDLLTRAAADSAAVMSA